jgi:hypothetical protein
MCFMERWIAKLHLTQKSAVYCNFFTKIDGFYKEI